MSLKNALPDFYEEVRLLLLKLERHDLAGQLKDLQIVYKCPCTNPGCASFRVGGSALPDAFEMPGARRSAAASSLNLNAEKGKVTVMMDPLGRIEAFEVLRRPDVRRKLLFR